MLIASARCIKPNRDPDRSSGRTGSVPVISLQQLFVRYEGADVLLPEEFLNNHALLLELLLSGFFAVACFRARAASFENISITPGALFALTDRLERLRRSRWQWASMVLILVLVRMQWGVPMVAELTVLAQFILFLALPGQKVALGAIRRR